MRTARLEAALLTRCDARSFRENDDPVASFQPFATLIDHLTQRVLAGLAVDRDHLYRSERPAEEGDHQQGLLQHEDLVGKNRLQTDRFPGRLMLGEDDRRRARDVLPPDDAVVQSENVAADRHEAGAPDGDEPEAHAHRQDNGQCHQKAERRGDQGGEDQVDDGPDDGNHVLRMCSTAAVRSLKTRVPAGRLPSASVFSPLPVRTRMGSAPAVTAASRSRSESPTA